MSKPNPIFEIVPGHYYLGQLFVAPPNAGFDVLAMAWKETLNVSDPQVPWRFRMRTRYYTSDHEPTFDGTDKDAKLVSEGKFPGEKTIDWIVEEVSRAIHMACRLYGRGAEVEYLPILGDHEVFAKVIQSPLRPGHMYVKEQKDINEAERKYWGLEEKT